MSTVKEVEMDQEQPEMEADEEEGFRKETESKNEWGGADVYSPRSPIGSA